MKRLLIFTVLCCLVIFCASWAGELLAKDAGAAFFAENARKEGVISLPSGLQYRVVRRGTGRSPQPGDLVTVQYRGRLRDGQEFDSSYHGDEAVTLSLAQAIPGWQEALQRMEEGAKWVVYVPPHLAYKKPDLLADQTVIFEIELLRVDTPAVTLPDLPAERAKQAVISLPSGLQYKVLRSGSGRRPQPTDTLTVRYRKQSGADSVSEKSFHSEGQATFRLDQAIPGWQAAFAEMEEGARWEFRVPAGLAYSKWGSPDLDTSIFEVELLAVSTVAASQTAAGSGRVFLDADTRQAGMISLPGGLLYRVVEQGKGTKPQRGDLVTLRYRGTLLDGRFFDSAYHSEGRETFRLDRAIPGWQDALQRMHEGDKWELYMPSEFAFTEWGPRGGRAVVFKVELVSVEIAPDALRFAPEYSS